MIMYWGHWVIAIAALVCAVWYFPIVPMSSFWNIDINCSIKDVLQGDW